MQDSATTGLGPLPSVRGLGATEFDSIRLADAEHHIPGEHAEDAHGKRNPPSCEVFVRQHGGRNNRDFLRNRHAERRHQQHEEYSDVGELRDKLLLEWRALG